MKRTPQHRAVLYGSQIHQGRTELGLTLAKFAEAIVEAAAAEGEELTLTHGAVLRWEQGLNEPALRFRPYIATVLGVDSRYIFPPGIPRKWVAA